MAADDPLNIIKSCAYCDEKSKEEYTGRIKRKYKLAGNPILALYLGQYSFHLLTTTQDACKKSVTLAINKNDWENRVNGQYLQEDVSYCDLRKHEYIKRADLLEKINDTDNGFKYVAKLCDLKCRELHQLYVILQKDHHISQEMRETIGISLSDTIPNELLLKLRLKQAPPHNNP